MEQYCLFATAHPIWTFILLWCSFGALCGMIALVIDPPPDPPTIIELQLFAFFCALMSMTLVVYAIGWPWLLRDFKRHDRPHLTVGDAGAARIS